MEITVKEIGFKLIPEIGGLCYELCAWKPKREVTKGRHVGTIARAGWVRLGAYPDDIPQGLALMLERRPTADAKVVRAVDAAVQEMRVARQAVLDAPWPSPRNTGRALVVEGLGYRLAAYPDGLCHRIWRLVPEHLVQKGTHAGQRVAERWVDVGMYPTDAAQGMAKILDLAINADPRMVLNAREATRIYRAAVDLILGADLADACELRRCA